MRCSRRRETPSLFQALLPGAADLFPLDSATVRGRRHAAVAHGQAPITVVHSAVRACLGAKGAYVAGMTIRYNLHRFGNDEFAVGHLINGDLPTDDEERWRIVDAPRYHIQKLLDEHLRAQAALRDCRDSGRPFVLFLRSFSSEHKGTRIQGFVAGSFSMHSPVAFQQWLKLFLEDEGIPIPQTTRRFRWLALRYG